MVTPYYPANALAISGSREAAVRLHRLVRHRQSLSRSCAAQFASPRTAKTLLNSTADCRALFYLRSDPNAKFENQLKLLGQVVPSVVITRAVGWQVVVCRVLSARAMCHDAISIPRPADVAAADVALRAGLLEDLGSLTRG